MSPLVITFLAIEFLIVAGGTFFGFRRGLGKTGVRFVYLVMIALFSLLISFLVVSVCAETILVMVRGQYSADLRKLIKASPELEALVEAFISGLIFPIIFAILFGTLQLLSLIEFGRVSRKILSAIFPKKEKDLASRISGAAMGFVISFVVAVILMSPVYMTLSVYASIPEDVLVAMTSEKKEERETTPSSQLMLKRWPSTDFEVPSFLVASRLVTNTLTGFETPNRVKTNVLAEIPILMEVADRALDTVDITGENGGDRIDVLTNACSILSLYVEDSAFVNELACDVICGFGVVLGRGDTIFEMSLDNNTDPALTPVVDSFMLVISETTPQTTKENLITLFGVPNDTFVPESKKQVAAQMNGVSSADYYNIGMVSAFMHIKYKMPENNSGPTEQQNKVISKAFITMADNDAMHEVFEEVALYASDVVMEKASDLLGENKQAVYEQAASSIEETIAKTTDATTEEKVGLVQEILDEAIKEFDVDIEDWEASILATCAVKEFSDEKYIDENGEPTVSIDDVKTFFGIID